MCSKEIEFAKESVYAVTFVKMHESSTKLIGEGVGINGLRNASKSVWNIYCELIKSSDHSILDDPWSFSLAMGEILNQVVTKREVLAIADYMKILKEAEADFAESETVTSDMIVAYLDERVQAMSKDWIAKLQL